MDNSATGKAVDAVESILSIARQSHFSDIERLCQDALSVYHDQDMDTRLRDEADEALVDAMHAASLNSLEMNHCMRFGIDVEQMEKGKKKIKDLIKLGTLNSRDYENVTDFDIIRQPIVDICITHKSDHIPEGYYRISLTPSQKSANIKSSTNGKTMYLCFKKDPAETPVTSVVIILPDRSEHVPPGFSVVKRDGRACNLNTGTGGERMFLCFKRDGHCNPITDLQVFFPTKGESMPKSFNLLDRSVRSVGLDLNMGTGGHKIALCYHQSLVNLECLRISFRKDGAVIRGRATSVMQSGDWSAQASPAMAIAAELPEDVPKPPVSGELTAVALAKRSLEEGRAVGSGEFDGMDDDNMTVPSAASDGDNLSDFNEDIQNFLMGGSAVQEAIVTVEDKLAPLSIRRCLHPILACLFVRQGNLFNISVDSVELLLTQTDFFNDDFKARTSSTSKTTIDLVIECLCERLDIYHENTNEQVLRLLKIIIERSHGCITRHSIKKIFRASVFVSSCYAAERHWLREGHMSPVQRLGEPLLSYEVQMALVQAVLEAGEAAPLCTHLPAFTPIAESTSANSLPSVKSINPTDMAETISENRNAMSDQDYVAGLLSGDVSENHYLVHDLVVNLIGDIVDTVELSRVSEAALLAVSKRSFTTASPKFWIDIENCSRSLFMHLPLRNAYVLLGGLCKVSYLGLGGYQPGAENGDKPLQYLGNKLLALESIREFCRRCRYKMKMSKLVGYQIRRLVVPCILANMEHALVEPRIFVKLMKLMTVLWRDWREHVRVEFSVLCEQMVLRVLNASPQRLPPIYPMIALREIFKWFEQPHLSLEMFVNFDMHSKYVADWNIFSHLSRAVCTLAKYCTKSPAVGADGNSKRNILNSPMPNGTSQLDTGPLASTQSCSVVGETSSLFGKTADPVTYHDVRMMALEVTVRITRSIMDASGHANMVQQSELAKLNSDPGAPIDKSIRVSGEAPVAAGWVERELESFEDKSGSSTKSIRKENDRGVSKSFDFEADKQDSPDKVGPLVGHPDTGPSPPRARQQRATSIRFSRTVNIQSSDLLSQAVQIYKEKDSMAKAVKFLVSKNFMSNTPQEYASFVRLYKNHFDPAAIGDFLGEGGRTKEEEHFWDQTRFRFTRAISFVEMELVTALRLYFTGCGFRLPGEAQKIDRFVTAFVHVYWQDNMSTSFCPYRQQDTVHLLSYAVIMLNTDLHKASVVGDTSRRGSTKVKQMTKEQFIHNLRGVDVDILTGTKYDVDPVELGKIYDNILARPIEMVVPSAATKASGDLDNGGGIAAVDNTSGDTLPVNPEARKRFSIDLLRGLRSAGELLRDLSNMKQRFFVIGVDTSISMELVQFMFEAAWHDFHDVSEALLTKICTEENVLFSALEILANALSVCIFLDMKVERLSFATQLMNFKTAVEKIESGWNTGPPMIRNDSSRALGSSIGDNENSWFSTINNVTPDTVMIAIKELHRVIVTLKDTIQICARHEATKTVMSKIEKQANIYDPNRFIIKDGDLSKRSRHGKMLNYHFFLFSDLLIYAHSRFSEYKVHVQLPLEDMNVALVDPADDPSDRSFFIEHPIKSFAVEAGSTAEKRAWMRELSAAIEACIKRRSRSLSLFDRFQEQGNQVTERQKLHHELLESPVPSTTSNTPYSILKRFSLSTLASVVGGTSSQALPATGTPPSKTEKSSASPASPGTLPKSEEKNNVGEDLSASSEKDISAAISAGDIELEFNAV